MKRKNKISISYIIGIALLISALVFATSAYYTSGNDRTGIFPQQLGDLKLVLYVDGADAISDVERLHMGGISPKNAYIAQYRSDFDNVRFWISIVENVSDAQQQVDLMIEGMKKTTMFSQPVKLTIDDNVAYYTKGNDGQFHYFFARDDMVVWLSIQNPDVEYQKRLVKMSIKEIVN